MRYLANWAICLQEVGLQVGIKQVARDALNCVIDGKHVHTLAILDISALQTANKNPVNALPVDDQVNGNLCCQMHVDPWRRAQARLRW